jgi:hypothetical protein
MPGTNSTIQAKTMPLEVSFDNHVTYKTVVCIIDLQVALTTDVEEDNTYCGPKVGQGPIKFNPSGNLVIETNPTSTEASFDELLEKMNSATAIGFRLQNPLSGSTGRGFYLKGDALITELTPQGTANGLMKTSFAMIGTGTLTTTAP